jgi:hypothetical protein
LSDALIEAFADFDHFHRRQSESGIPSVLNTACCEGTHLGVM